MIQGSQEWHEFRCGKVTASRIADVTAKTKTGWGASRGNYMAELITERLTSLPYPSYKSASMQWGTDNEPFARAGYEFQTGQDVTLVAFVDHPIIPASGASPDGLVDFDVNEFPGGLVEFKCPDTKAHIETLLGAEIEGAYIKQMQWQMACTGRLWCDFASFDPRLPEEMRLHIRRVPRDDKMIAELEKDVKAFLIELDNKVAALRTKYDLRGTLEASAA